MEIARRPEVVRTALRYALIVGPILIFINHGDAILNGTMTTTAWLQSGITLLVPYTVSTLSSVSAYRSCNQNDETSDPQ